MAVLLSVPWLPAATTTITPRLAAWSNAIVNARSSLMDGPASAALTFTTRTPASVQAVRACASSSGSARGSSIPVVASRKGRTNGQNAVGADRRSFRSAGPDEDPCYIGAVRASDAVDVATWDGATRPDVLNGPRSQVGMVRGNRAVNQADRNLGTTLRDLHQRRETHQVEPRPEARRAHNLRGCGGAQPGHRRDPCLGPTRQAGACRLGGVTTTPKSEPGRGPRRYEARERIVDDVGVDLHSHPPPADACWCDKEARRASAWPARMAATSAAIAALFCFSRALSWVESQA